MDIPESQNSRDARIEALWKKLDPKGKGEIDIDGLQRGLKKIDHPLKNADNMLEDIVKAMDKNGDRVIQYDEFRIFVEETEKELYTLFQSIDRDHNGKVYKEELQTAFKKAGLAVPSAKLSQFFEEVDANNDGYISYEEWRNFLLFLPTNSNTPPLKAVLSYYSSTVSLNAEGDVSIREDTLEGLGKPKLSFLNVLFGSIINITASQRGSQSLALPPTDVVESTDFANNASEAKEPSLLQGYSLSTEDEPEEEEDISEPVTKEKSLLIQLLPDPGYFAAGGIAGVISRTATAPLDRLKVYLIANVGEVKGAIPAVTKGEPIKAIRHLGGPLTIACKELWAAGGIRSLFAGNGLNVLKVMPESAIKFGSYEFAKKSLAQLEGHGDSQNINPYSKFVAGGVGGMVSQLVVYPIDTLKFRMQCEIVSGGSQGNKLIFQTWKSMIAQGGFRAPYRGLTMGLVGMFPYSAIDLGTFEALKSLVTAHNAKIMGCHEDDALPGSLATGIIGACSGAFGASVVYPINVIRTRLQAQGTVLHPPTYTGAKDAFRKTVQKEGFKGLFKGITPNLLKVVPAVSITYVVYENAKRIMNLK